MKIKKRSREITLEKKNWYQNTRALLIVAGALVGVGSGLIAIFQSGIFKPEKVMENIEIVIDGSDAMRKPFEGKTKFEAAIKVLKEILSGQEATNQDNLALRYYGGPCDGNNNQLLVKFSQNNAEKISRSVRNIKLGGKAPLSSAIISASGDFNDPKRFEGMQKRIIVITGSSDSCVLHPEEFIRSRLMIGSNKEDFVVSFRFIGMDLPPDQQEQLGKIAVETKGIATQVKSEEELRKALERIVIVEPIETYIATTTSILNTIVGHINTMFQSVDRKDYSAAENSLKEARSEFTRTELPFQDFSKKQSKGKFQELYQLARENRDIQNNIIALSEAIIAYDRSENLSAYKDSITKYNDLVSKHNNNSEKMNEIIRNLK